MPKVKRVIVIALAAAGLLAGAATAASASTGTHYGGAPAATGVHYGG